MDETISFRSAPSEPPYLTDDGLEGILHAEGKVYCMRLSAENRLRCRSFVLSLTWPKR